MTVTTAATGSKQEPLLTRSFMMLGLADLAYFTAVGVAIYALPLYVTGPLGGDEAGAGVAFGAFAVSALLLRPLGGRLTDTWGRRPMLVSGALIAAVSLALTPLADSLALVIALRLVSGVAEAAFFVASLAALVDLAPPSRMGEAISYNSLGLYLGLAFGPPLGELLVESSSFNTAWLGAGALAVLASVVVLGIPETRDGSDPAQADHAMIHRRAIPAALAFLTSLLAISGFLSFSSLHAHDVGLSSTSLPLFLYGSVVVFCRVAFAKVPDRLPPLALGAAALGAIASGLLLMATWTTPAGLLAGVVVTAVGVTFSTPAFFSAIFATAEPAERGAASGTASLSIDIGLGGGPIVLGFVAQASGISSAMFAGSATALVGVLGTLWLAARTRSGSPAALRS